MRLYCAAIGVDKRVRERSKDIGGVFQGSSQSHQNLLLGGFGQSSSLQSSSVLEVVEAADGRCHLDECPDSWRRQTTLLTKLVPDDHPIENVLEQIAMLQARRGTLGFVVDHGPDGEIMIVMEFSVVLVVSVHVCGNVDEIKAIGATNRHPLLVRFLCHLGDRGGHALGVEVEIAFGGLDPARIHKCRRAVHDRVDVVQSHLEEVLTPHQALRED